MAYRRIQIFIIVCNQCLQIYFWPVLNFLGGFAIIGMFYSLVLFQKQLPLLGVMGIFVLAMITLLLCCLMFHMGSRSILISKKVLKRVKTLNKCKWSKRFWKSCPTIALMMGAFHRMDRARGPAFIRFILQRTHMLVIKTRLDVNYGGVLEISVPFNARTG